MSKAELKFRNAIALQPDYAAFWAAFLDALFHEVDEGEADARTTMPKAKEAALRAVALDDNSGEAHMALGIIRLHYDWDWDAAEREFDTATRLLPGSGYVRHWRAHLLSVQGRVPEAIAEMKSALALDPLSPMINGDLVMLYHSSHQFRLAVSQMRRVTLPGARGSSS